MSDDSGSGRAEIDLLFLLTIMGKYKWRIVTLVVLAILIAVGIAVLTPKQFTASALVVISKPIIIYHELRLDDNIGSYSRINNDFLFRSLRETANARDLLQLVYQSPELAGYRKKHKFQKFEKELRARPVEKINLRLIASASDPETAALIANLWAEKCTERLEDLYNGTGQDSSSFNRRAAAVKEKWDKAVSALASHPGSSKVAALEAADVSLRVALLQCQQATVDTQLRAMRGAALLAALDGRDPKAPLLPGELARLAQLITTPDKLAVGNAASRLAEAKIDLDAQQADLDAGGREISRRIGELSNQLLVARQEVEVLATSADLYGKAYRALTAEAVASSAEGATQVVKQVGRASPPPAARSSLSLLKLAFAAGLGFVIALGWACASESLKAGSRD